MSYYTKEDLNIDIAELLSTDTNEFMEILWTALNPDGVTGRTRAILNDPMVKAYYENWGYDHDNGYAAIIEGKIVGAIWCRIKSCVTKEYSDYPELAIGVLPEYQDQGIGSILLNKLIDKCKTIHPGLRLGVNENAKRVLLFYEKFGFTKYDKYNGAPQLKLTF